jgi:hypothetical protein
MMDWTWIAFFIESVGISAEPLGLAKILATTLGERKDKGHAISVLYFTSNKCLTYIEFTSTPQQDVWLITLNLGLLCMIV